MRTHARVVAGTTGIVLAVLLAAALFLRYQIHKSFPATTGSLTLAGLERRATVDRDAYGVPTVSALTEHDLMFAAGFVQAQDRLWQMDLTRRAGEGRLSELFGKQTIPFDRMFRIIGIRKTAEEIVASLDSLSLERLHAFSDGVNACILHGRGKYPAEFDLLGYEPELWTPVHSVIIGRMMAWELNLSWWTDLTYASLADRVGPGRLADIMPVYPGNVPPVVPAAEWRSYASLGRGYLETARAYAAAFSSASLVGGSNAWVVSPARSATGAVLLANDTHLRLESPSRWYEMQMQMPGFRVRGMAIAGVPAIVAGRNDSLAWGITNVMADDADFYIEKLDSASRYLYGAEWRPLTVTQETINVRGDTAVTVVIRSTGRGPLVTDIEIPVSHAHPSGVASMRWTGNEVDNQFGAFAAINRARNRREFVAGVRLFAVPGQNFVYGDAAGNIGYWCGAKIPLRGGRSMLLPQAGWDPASGWHGYVPFESLPHRWNPPEGYIATANNKIVDDAYPYPISSLWEPESRIERLNEILGTKDDMFSPGDFERLQNDAFSFYAREMTPLILHALATRGTPDDTVAAEYLRNWNWRFAQGEIGCAIFQQFFVRLLRNVYADEMGDDLFHDWVLLTNIPLRVTAHLLQEGSSAWFDDVRSPAVETRDDMIRKSMQEAMGLLRARFGPDTRRWRWGDMHTVTLRHPFGERAPLDRIFNLGPVPIDGGSTALVSGEYDFTEPFAVTVGPSFRQVFDFSGHGAVRSVLPSGESGQVFHPHYGDQLRLWVNGGYRTSSFAAGEQGEVLTLEPAR
jgi:penicillin G amidase